MKEFSLTDSITTWIEIDYSKYKRNTHRTITRKYLYERRIR